MPEIEHLYLPVIVGLGFWVKALTGFGPSIIIVGLGSIFFPVQTIIPTNAFLDILAGAWMLRLDWSRDGFRYWVPLSVLMILGSVVGGVLLKFISPAPLKLLISITILLLGLWFVLQRMKVDESTLVRSLPPSPSFSDGSMTFLGGFFGGLIGIGGPPLVWQFGRQFPKRLFRQILTPILLGSSIARVIVYMSIGMINEKVLVNTLFCIPGLVVGLYLGNHIFSRVNENGFRKLMGVLLVLVAIQLLRSN